MSRFFVSLFGMLAVSAVALPAQQVGQNMQVKVSKVRMHSGASVDSAKVRDLTKGTVVTVVATDGNWVKVKLADQKTMGWIRDDMLDAAPGMSGADATATSASDNGAAMAAPPPPPTRMAPPPPPPTRTAAPTPPLTTPTPLPAPHTNMSSPSRGQHGGLALFGGLTQFKFSSSVAGNNANVTNASGFVVGLGGVAPLGGHFGLEIDADYAQKGTAYSYSGTKGSTHVNNAEADLLLRPVFGNGSAKLFLLGGGYAAVAINCKYSPASSGACKITSDENRIDYGADVGAGIMYGRIALQGRYQIGVANLNNSSTKATEKIKNKGFEIMIGFVL